MAEQFSAEWAKSTIENGVQKAQSFIDDPEQINALLEELQEKLMGLPDTISKAFENVPVMAQMVKSYVTREYTDVSPKVIISLVSAFVYLVKKNDIIPDDVPIVGYADDLAVATVAMAINEPELQAYSEWRAQNGGAPIELVEVEPVAPVAQVEPIAQVEPVVEVEPTAQVESAASAAQVDPADPAQPGAPIGQ